MGIAVDWKELNARAAAALARLGVELPLNAEVRRLSVAQQQMVEIAKALSTQARVIVMDEPTAALTEDEVLKLFEIIRTLKAQGVGIVYISHRLEEVFQIADRITVFRDGKHVKTDAVSAFTTDDLIKLMVGRSLAAHFPELPPDPPREHYTALRPQSHARLVAFPMSHSMSIRARFLALLVSWDRVGPRCSVPSLVRIAYASGTVMLEGDILHLRGPHDAIEAGIALVTEDRKTQGLILGMSVRENVTLPHLEEFVHYGHIERGEETKSVANLATELHIRTLRLSNWLRTCQVATNKKWFLAKWLLKKAKFICFDEPTRGIDVGAKAEIYDLMVELAKSGTGILMASSDMPEVLGMSMRIGVMRNGSLVHIFNRGEATQEEVARFATGSRPLTWRKISKPSRPLRSRRKKLLHTSGGWRC